MGAHRPVSKLADAAKLKIGGSIIVETRIPLISGNSLPASLKVPDGLDAAAARAISTAREGIIGAANLVSAAGVEAINIVAPSLEGKRSRMQHLSHYASQRSLDQLVLVGGFHPSNSEAENRQAAQLLVSTLIAAGAVLGKRDEDDPMRAVALQPIVPAAQESSRKELDRLRTAAMLAGEIIAERTRGPEPLLQGNQPLPVYIAENTNARNTEGAYEPIERAAGEWEGYVADHAGELGFEGDERPPLTIVLVIDPGRATRLFRGFDFGEMYNGGAVTLKSANSNLWLPLARKAIAERAQAELVGGERRLTRPQANLQQDR